MGAIIGLVTLFVCVFGSYVVLGHGKMEPIMEAMVGEMVTIGGAAVASFLISNPGTIAKKTMKDIPLVFKGNPFKKQDYIDLLTLLYLLAKLIKSKGIIAVESHIENPHESSIFNQFPKVAHDHFAIDLICDTLRMMTMNMSDPHQVENSIDKQIEKHHHEGAAPSGAIQNMADATPALGIVAAVLGIIKTMSSIDQPPTILGGMIGHALVGTFLGVFLAYGIFGPFAKKLENIYHEEVSFYYVIRDVLVAFLHGNAVQVAVEIGRGSVPSHMQPKFSELEEVLNNAKIEG